MTEQKTIFLSIYELETSDHFDELVKYANTQASNIERALIYINIIEIFAKILEIEFENKVKPDRQKILNGFKRWKRNKIRNIPNELISKEYSNIASWNEIANKLNIYRKYRNDFVHNLLIDRNGKRIRTIDEINEIIFITGELAEEIYNLIIGAREYLDFEFDWHKNNHD